MIVNRIWTSQPRIAVPIRPELRPIAGINPGAFPQTGFGMMGTDGRMLTSGIQLTRVFKPEGMAIDGGGLNGGLTRATSYTDHPFSFVFVGRTDGSGAAVYSSLATTADKTVRVYANSANIEAQHIGATTNAAAATGNVWTFGTPYVAVAVFASPTDVRVYGKGVVGKSRGQTTTDVGALGTLNKLAFCTYDGSSKTLRHVGQIALAQWFRYAFTDEEADKLLENPWGIFQPIPRYWFVPSSGGGAAADLSLAPTAVATAAVSLTTAISLAAAPSAVTTAAASLTTAISLSSAPSAVATAAASLTTAISLSSFASSAVTAVVDLTTPTSLSAAASTVATATVDLNTAISLGSTATIAATAAVDLSTAIGIAATATGTVTATVDLTAGSGVFGSATAVATAAVDLTTAIALSSDASATSASSVELATAIALSFNVSVVASAAADVTLQNLLSAAAEAAATALVDLTTEISLSASAGARASASVMVSTGVVGPGDTYYGVVLVGRDTQLAFAGRDTSISLE
jgi:hypothetical protein